MKYIYGPVQSRRLGLSLGVNLVPYKTCNFDCIYCEAGLTNRLTNEVKEWFPLQEIIDEIKTYLKEAPEAPDCITLAGGGEPTLYSRINELILWLKKNTTQKIIVITNGSTLVRKDIRNNLLEADMVLPSLDAASEEGLKRLNRPVKGINANSIIEGLIAFRKEYKKEIWLEVFFAQGINDTKADIESLNLAVHRIKPNRIQLNTLDRPAPESWVKPVEYNHLKKIASLLEPFSVDILAPEK